MRGVIGGAARIGGRVLKTTAKAGALALGGAAAFIIGQNLTEAYDNMQPPKPGDAGYYGPVSWRQPAYGSPEHLAGLV